MFNCNQCNKKYKHKGSLQRHNKEKHEGIKRCFTYHCLLCDKHFYDISHFQRHRCVTIHKKIIECYYKQ